MKRCKYGVYLLYNGQLHSTQCERKNVLGSSGWHMHKATLPEFIIGHPNVKVRWASTNTPDHYMES